MSPGTRRLTWLFLTVAALIALTAGGILYWRLSRRPHPGAGRALPGPGSETYREMVSAFFAGVVALDADAPELARVKLSRALELVPGEPAAWANRGLLSIRLQDYEAAVRDLVRARNLAPEVGAIERLFGLLESRRGDSAGAIAHYRRAIERAPDDMRAHFSLAQEIERQGGPEADVEAGRQMAAILKARPENLQVLLEQARLAAKVGDNDALKDVVARLGPLAPRWPTLARERYRTLEEAARGQDQRLAVQRIIFIRNALVLDPAFRRDQAAVMGPAGIVGEPIERFLRLPMPTPTAAPPDESITFGIEPSEKPGDAHPYDSLIVAPLNGDSPPALLQGNGHEVRLADRKGDALTFPGGSTPSPTTPDGILAIDWNSDYAMDLVLAGAGGLRLFKQEKGGTFADVTQATGLAPDVIDAAAVGAWAADIELDGDLDIIIGLKTGPPRVLQNRGDGTFGTLQPFPEIAALRGFAWADFDRDGAPDAALLDAQGILHVFRNGRAGRFVERPVPKDLGTISALTIGDLDADGAVDLDVWRTDGSIARLSDRDEGRDWESAEVARWPAQPVNDPRRLFVADLDNNGNLDLIAAGLSESRAWLGDESGRLRPLRSPIGFRVLGVADLNSDGRLDLAGLSKGGGVVRAPGKGSRAYHWQVIRPRAAKVVGDGRINSFGLGGEIEVRAGLLVQKQVIAGPIVHFGLGDHPGADVARVVWPNGTVQAEFDTTADQVVAAPQRLKGSCPFVFAHDGVAVKFVTDFLWRSPLGLRINAQDTAGVSQTEDWIKIRGDQLAPIDGYYDVRITAELWETHYFDHVSLLAVDHPTGTEIFVDERFAPRPPALAVQQTGPLRPVVRAWDDSGRDVTDVVRSIDGRYLDKFGRGQYQGVTRDHWLEVEVPADTPRSGKLLLVARGWIHPTDSSINVAISQGGHTPPSGLTLEVPTTEGDWVIARPDLGFPAGKDKTILINLDGVFQAGAPRRLRLRTNLEIYWDALAITEARDRDSLETQRLAPASAELRPRGYSSLAQADASSPERPEYHRLDGVGQRWRDLIGHYTRFGDVRELLRKVDDRYVIANAGDELALRFPAPAAPASGMVRDFVLIGDGWNKDGDYNTAFSKTVLPLPSHNHPAYDTPPGALEDDPTYRRHARDWDEYHTRYITPRTFLDALRPEFRAGPERIGVR